MRLVTNYWDSYDHEFNGQGLEFRRRGDEGPNKVEQFKILQELGYTVPEHGKVSDLLYKRSGFLVVYEDIQAHCGEGKILLQRSRVKWDGNISLLPFYDSIKDKFCCEYIPDCHGYSWRWLQIGKYKFWIEYWSTEDWRSNCGDGECTVIGQEIDKKITWNRPLLAIDFVIGKELYAIDFNICPGIKHSGVEKILTSKEIVKEIEDFYENR